MTQFAAERCRNRTHSATALWQDEAVLCTEEQADPVALSRSWSLAVGLHRHDTAFCTLNDVMNFRAHVDDVDDLAWEQIVAGPIGFDVGPNDRNPLGPDADAPFL